MNLFLDDERFPPHDGKEWKIARTDAEFKKLVTQHKFKFISWDHDLGPNSQTGHDLAMWLINRDMDLDGTFIPPDFTYYVHSMNPVGKKNIIGLLDGYLAQR